VGTTIDELLERARARITRLTPTEARLAAEQGALIVDIRDQYDRERDGAVPGSVHIPRTVLEWRLAPGSEWRNPHVDPRRRLILLCAHGYSSSLAASTLVELGLDAADVAGGFQAWRDAGLPVRPAEPTPSSELPGMSAPDGGAC
jgi:rhodanese-related sulfurtransferase